MGIVQFPVRHVRTSVSRDASRATSPAIVSAESPSARVGAAAKTEAHHSAGILSRCHHFDTAEGLAPSSAAIASREGQSSMIERNEVGSAIAPIVIGQLVLECKANVSYDYEQPVCQNGDMADRMSETEEKLAFIGRVRAARLARFETQKPMLTILGVDQGTYKQYETRTPLPHRFIPKFCAATGVEIEWLLTGEGKGPVRVEIPKQVPRRIGRAPRGKAA